MFKKFLASTHFKVIVGFVVGGLLSISVFSNKKVDQKVEGGIVICKSGKCDTLWFAKPDTSFVDTTKVDSIK